LPVRRCRISRHTSSPSCRPVWSSTCSTPMVDAHAVEAFSAGERRALAPYFTNLDRPVFALRNLPEVVKAALFARYSRSPKSLRRLFLDEFLADGSGVSPHASDSLARTAG